MKIHGMEGLGPADLQHEIDRDGKFGIYSYVISALIVTFRRNSDVYFARGGRSGVGPRLPFVFLALFLGWWGFPWGPIYSVGSLYSNLRGGKDVTTEVVNSFRAAATTAPPPISTHP